MPTCLPVLTSATRLLSGSASSSPMSPHDQPPPPQPPTVPLGRLPQHPHLEQPFVICGLHGAAVATCWPARSPPGAIAACSSWPLPLPSGVRFWLGLGPAQRPLCHPPCSLQRPCFLSPRVRAVRAWPTLSSSRRRLSKHSPEAAPPGLSWGGAGCGVGVGRGQGRLSVHPLPTRCVLASTPLLSTEGPGLRLAVSAPSSPLQPVCHQEACQLPAHGIP